MEFDGVKGSDTSAYVLLYMLDRGENEVIGSATDLPRFCGYTGRRGFGIIDA